MNCCLIELNLTISDKIVGKITNMFGGNVDSDGDGVPDAEDDDDDNDGVPDSEGNFSTLKMLYSLQ